MDKTDASLRLAALQQAQSTHGPVMTGAIIDRAVAFYAFLTGGFVADVAPQPPLDRVAPGASLNPLPLAGEPPIVTGAEKAANEAIKRTRRTKAEMEAARAAEERQTAREHAYEADREAIAKTKFDALELAKSATAATPAPAAEPPTMLDVKAAAMRVVERDGLGQEAAFAIVKSFGVTRISALDESQFAPFIADCNEKLA